MKLPCGYFLRLGSIAMIPRTEQIFLTAPVLQKLKQHKQIVFIILAKKILHAKTNCPCIDNLFSILQPSPWII